ncbi:MAG: hypothetical protein MUF78_09055 [Candidatus Edwardsbacteria bacterium]|nr:hypothetical protein [Candidatus Edwardsbacteria bacterium]
MAAISALLLTASAVCLADGGNYEPDLNAREHAPLYPGSLAFAPDRDLDRVTNDGLKTIEAFYRKHAGPNELIEPFAKENERGFTLTYRVKIEGVLTQRAQLTVTTVDTPAVKAMWKRYPTAAVLPLPLDRLQQLIGRFDHTQQDYDALFDRYQWLRFVKFYREPGSDRVTGGGEIYQRHYEQVFGPITKTAPQDKAGDAATRADLERKKKKLKQLKQEGNMQEMMALAMEMQGQMEGTAAGEAAMEMQGQQLEGVQKDSWDEWVACLKEMAAAVYWVRLEYSDSGDFWTAAK